MHPSFTNCHPQNCPAYGRYECPDRSVLGSAAKFAGRNVPSIFAGQRYPHHYAASPEQTPGTALRFLYSLPRYSKALDWPCKEMPRAMISSPPASCSKGYRGERIQPAPQSE